MIVRQGTIEEFSKLWNYNNTPTYQYFLSQQLSKNVEFWTVEDHQRLIAELFIFWKSKDPDEANGINRAYLCAFRVQKQYQSKGIGSSLMKTVLLHIRNKGYLEVTIGIDQDDFTRLSNIYTHFGFTISVKKKYKDIHYLDSEGRPVEYKEPYTLVKCML